jgi:electron transfer flavoprotein alpha subunit
MTVFCLVELDGAAGAAGVAGAGGSAGTGGSADAGGPAAAGGVAGAGGADGVIGAGGTAGVADVSLRAITLARELAASSSTGESGEGGGLAAVVFAGPSAGGPGSDDGPGSVVGSGLVADLAAYGVTDVYAVSGIDGYAPLAWARVLQWLLSPNPGLHPSPDEPAHRSPDEFSHRSSDEPWHRSLDEPWHRSSDEPAHPSLDEFSHRSPDESPHPWPEFSGHAVVAAGTERGNEVLAHLGAITGLPMAANCTAAVDNGGGAYSIVRQRWAGLLLEEAVLEAPAALLTVATDAVSPVPAEAAAPVAVHHVSPSVDGSDLTVRAAETPAGAGGASLATARVVVGGGRGVGSADGFAPLEELAALLGGVVGVSRVVTSEGWRPHSQQVGQTGTKITPDLYLACGISGAIQHIAGCSGAKHLIAINKDPAAPMVTRADYAVIGDLHEIVPALVQAIKDRADR